MALPIFGGLGIVPIQIWDEARLANNTLEMLQGGDWLQTQYAGSADMWNSKPPLLIWIQLLSVKLLGFNEFSFRLPSAVAAFGCCMLLFVFLKKYLEQPLFAAIAALVLVTSYGFTGPHVARSGDYDALLLLFTSLAAFSFFAYTESGKRQYLYAMFMAFSLAVLTKSVAALLLVPGLVFYALWRKKLFSLLKNKHFYGGAALFLLLPAAYYLLREARDPGYLQAVWLNDFGRYAEATPENRHAFSFYLLNFHRWRLSFWYLLIPCGIALGLFSKAENIKRLSVFSALTSFCYLLLISFSQTKLYWYDAQLYPFFAILIAIFVHFVFEILQDIPAFSHKLTFNIVPYIFLFLILLIPYRDIMSHSLNPKVHPLVKRPFYEVSYQLQAASHGKQNLQADYLLYEGYYAHLRPYLYLLQKKGTCLSHLDWRQLKAGDRVLVPQKNIQRELEKRYRYRVLRKKGGVVSYWILALR